MDCLLHIAALILAIGISPWFISSLLFPRNSWGLILAGWGPAMMTVNILVPLTLHLGNIPITPDSLALAHLGLAGITLILWQTFRPRQPAPQETLSPPNYIPDGLLIAGLILFALLILPLTHIAGIDTYKWQDLASNIAVEQRISWLIHPLSLFGFTPRAYSSAQPLILASIQMLGHTGVDWGFYILSLTFGLTAFSGAWLLGTHLFKKTDSAAWLAILYTLSPVFMRYNYWATGRGLLLALLPLYLLILIKLGTTLRRTHPTPRRALLWLIPAWLLMTSLIMMAHKAGVIGALLIPLLFAISPALALFRGRHSLWLMTAFALAAGLLFTQGHPIALASRLLTRFGWLLPLALYAIVTQPNLFRTFPFRALFVTSLATLILASTADMYGALLALPFIACLATCAMATLPCRVARYLKRSPPWRGGIPVLIVTVIALPAIAIVLNQMRDSPPDAIYRVAQFIEQHDPHGPFRIDAPPGPARHQIQAYVSGCPRFSVHATDRAHVRLNVPIPRRTGDLPHDVREWIGLLRNLLELQDATTDWYGSSTKVYYVTIDGQGSRPAHAKLLFSTGNVSLFE